MSRGLTTCLLSGGIDSAAAASSVAAAGEAQAVFVNYGQLAAVHEAKAARALAHHLAVPLAEVAVAVAGLEAGVGEIPGRNALFVHVALALAAGRPGVIVLGIHAGTGYRDCSSAFVRTMQESLAFHSDGALRLHAPLLDLNKKQVFDMAVARGIPLHLTRSCEGATETPCGDCRSCRDMEPLGATR